MIWGGENGLFRENEYCQADQHEKWHQKAPKTYLKIKKLKSEPPVRAGGRPTGIRKSSPEARKKRSIGTKLAVAAQNLGLVLY